MTLPSRHRIRNSSFVGLRRSTLPLSHGGSPQCSIFMSERRETFCFFETWMPEQGSNSRSPTFQECSFNHRTRAPTNCRVTISYLLMTSLRDPYVTVGSHTGNGSATARGRCASHLTPGSQRVRGHVRSPVTWANHVCRHSAQDKSRDQRSAVNTKAPVISLKWVSGG